jgi:hypothetical protein
LGGGGADGRGTWRRSVASSAGVTGAAADARAIRRGVERGGGRAPEAYLGVRAALPSDGTAPLTLAECDRLKGVDLDHYARYTRPSGRPGTPCARRRRTRGWTHRQRRPRAWAGREREREDDVGGVFPRFLVQKSREHRIQRTDLPFIARHAHDALFPQLQKESYAQMGKAVAQSGRRRRRQGGLRGGGGGGVKERGLSFLRARPHATFNRQLRIAGLGKGGRGVRRTRRVTKNNNRISLLQTKKRPRI